MTKKQKEQTLLNKDVSLTQDVSNRDVSTTPQHDEKDQKALNMTDKGKQELKDQDMMSSHSEALAEESKIESNHDSSHSEGVLQSKTTEESNQTQTEQSNKDTSQDVSNKDVSNKDVSGLKALNMTDRGKQELKDQDMMSSHSERSEESHNKDVSPNAQHDVLNILRFLDVSTSQDVSAMPQHDVCFLSQYDVDVSGLSPQHDKKHSEESNHDSSHSEGVLQSKTTEESHNIRCFANAQHDVCFLSQYDVDVSGLSPQHDKKHFSFLNKSISAMTIHII